MTDKTFEPVVTEGMVSAFSFGGHTTDWTLFAGLRNALAHPDFQRQLRAYAAEVARAMLHDEIDEDEGDQYARGFNDYRERTLSAIDEWEKNDANR